jgi:hypothetical protein
MAEPVPTDTVLKLSREDRKPKDPGIEVPFIQRRGRIPAFPPPHHSSPHFDSVDTVGDFTAKRRDRISSVCSRWMTVEDPPEPSQGVCPL